MFKRSCGCVLGILMFLGFTAGCDSNSSRSAGQASDFLNDPSVKLEQWDDMDRETSRLGEQTFNDDEFYSTQDRWLQDKMKE